MIKLKSLLKEYLFENSLLDEDTIKKVSVDVIRNKGMRGPFYHGTSAYKREMIDKEGFKVFYGKQERTGDISHGYDITDYEAGIPAPLHHFGFGIYFTAIKSIAKKFNLGTMRGLKEYFLDVPNTVEINFASPRKMMDWWIKNGYDYKITNQSYVSDKNINFDLNVSIDERYRATINMTNVLKSKYDAVYFTSKGMYSLLDGNQICVYDPNNIYLVDYDTSPRAPMVIAKHDIVNGTYATKRLVPKGTKGFVTDKTPTKERLEVLLEPSDDEDTKRRREELIKKFEGSTFVYIIQWTKGGNMYNVPDTWVEPYEKK